jgi:hypothetical protein
MDKQDTVKNYITLQEATTYCQYSQEYLSLRARSGKLRAVKLGRNWTTKKEWLDEYFATVENYKEYIEECKARKINKEENIETIKEFTKQVVAPENLPVCESGFFERIKNAVYNFSYSEFFSPKLGFGLVSAFASVLVIAGCVFGNSSLINVSRQADSFAKIISSSGDIVANGILDVSQKSVLAFSDNINGMAENIGGAEIAVAEKALNYSNENIMATIAFFNAMGNATNDIGDSGDSLMTASVENFKTALDGVSALTYIVGNAGGEVVGGSLAGAKDLAYQSGKASSFVVGNAKVGKSAIDLQASAFTEYSSWAFDTIRGKFLSFGYSIKYFASNFQQESGNALYSLKENAVDEFNNLSYAISEKTNNIFAFVQGIPGFFSNSPTNKLAETENLSSIASQDEKGIVAIPVESGNEEATKEKIKSFFSDEVEVSPKDADSGIIIPVFKEKKGGEYMYMMVPINNKN